MICTKLTLSAAVRFDIIMGYYHASTNIACVKVPIVIVVQCYDYT